MKDAADNMTAELIPMPKKRGRPATGKAMTAAERKRAQRARDRRTDVGLIVDAPNKVPNRVLINEVTQGDDYVAFLAWLEVGERKGWITSQDRIAMRNRMLDKT